MKTIQQVEEKMTAPSDALIQDMKKVDGDVLILGAGGKMGPTLAKLAKNALMAGGSKQRVIAVSRFSESSTREDLEKNGVETISADLLREEQLKGLPQTANVVYMAGNKFGTKGNEHFTWAMNTYLPGRVAEHFRESRIVSFSTGNVYPLTEIKKGGPTEEHEPGPVGEYAQSSLGRERIFTYFSHHYRIPMVHFRLNYAIDMRYGVLLEVAKAVHAERPIDVTMGHVNVIWQGDANEMALRSLLHCQSPPVILNITGPETVSIRWLAGQFGKRFNKKPEFTGEEQPAALISNAAKSHQLFGYPNVPLLDMIDWTADWVLGDGKTINKPTHFQERQGAY
ncbi:NAD(P)-dependent oxidoreductase [Bacillus sp. FJAT-42376]|uniref:NAD-dependent epimerase/dehydratase family protein n=1 Tax=Bacillus sp. FJAT-42376 TaxID=2014076 RepID=UPI000F514F83|nr:NAD-dependent epimerase/dehydratase family protein [Bacillus sp. FJAT-42376]AZB42739.1 NAD(P)-dependent oxidoreductase [Bacillus sp. FJAT-42376]